MPLKSPCWLGLIPWVSCRCHAMGTQEHLHGFPSTEADRSVVSWFLIWTLTHNPGTSWAAPSLLHSVSSTCLECHPPCFYSISFWVQVYMQGVHLQQSFLASFLSILNISQASHLWSPWAQHLPSLSLPCGCDCGRDVTWIQQGQGMRKAMFLQAAWWGTGWRTFGK